MSTALKQIIKPNPDPKDIVGYTNEAGVKRGKGYTAIKWMNFKQFVYNRVGISFLETRLVDKIEANSILNFDTTPSASLIAVKLGDTQLPSSSVDTENITKTLIDEFNTHSYWVNRFKQDKITIKDIERVQEFNKKTDAIVQVDGRIGTQTLQLVYPLPFWVYQQQYGATRISNLALPLAETGVLDRISNRDLTAAWTERDWKNWYEEKYYENRAANLSYDVIGRDSGKIVFKPYNSSAAKLQREFLESPSSKPRDITYEEVLISKLKSRPNSIFPTTNLPANRNLKTDTRISSFDGKKHTTISFDGKVQYNSRNGKWYLAGVLGDKRVYINTVDFIKIYELALPDNIIRSRLSPSPSQLTPNYPERPLVFTNDSLNVWEKLYDGSLFYDPNGATKVVDQLPLEDGSTVDIYLYERLIIDPYYQVPGASDFMSLKTIELINSTPANIIAFLSSIQLARGILGDFLNDNRTGYFALKWWYLSRLSTENIRTYKTPLSTNLDIRERQGYIVNRERSTTIMGDTLPR